MMVGNFLLTHTHAFYCKGVEGTGFWIPEASSGVVAESIVASILMVSPGLDCQGMSLAEVCAT